MSDLVKHLYFEVGSDLLAKPTALTQLIDGWAVPAAIVFCNTPSDTDLVEVLLKKRGVSARKLIGNVPQEKLDKTLEQLQSGELSTIVVTDIAAKNIDIDLFDLVINYATPGDVDVYQSRFHKEEGHKRLKTVATLIGPLDITNFHYVKKALEGTLEAGTLPSAEDIRGAKATRIKNQAVIKSLYADEKYKSLVDSILGMKEKQDIVAFLLQNTLEVLPSLQASSERAEDYFDDEDDSQPSYNGHRGQNQGRDNRNSRNNHRDDRGGRNRGGQGRSEHPNEEGALQAREAQARIKRKVNLPPLREARIYIGKGKKSGLDEAALRSMVTKETDLQESDIRRVIVRNDYIFFDILDEQANPVIEKLGKEDLLVKKATVISTQRQEYIEDEGLDTAPTLEELQAQSVLS